MLEKLIKELNNRGEAYLRIKARPGASKTAIRGMMDMPEGETLKVDIAAPPEKGKANEELISFLAKEFDLKKDQIKIISGAGDKIKLIKIKN